MGVPDELRLAALALIGFGAFSAPAAPPPRPGLADEIKVEEWGRCNRAEPVNFTVFGVQVFGLQMRRPL